MLYEQSKDLKKILLYELKGQKEILKWYKKSFLTPNFYLLETTNSKLAESFYTSNLASFTENDLLKQETIFVDQTKKELTFFEKLVRTKLLDRFYEGKYFDQSPVSLAYQKELKDYFLSLTPYETAYDNQSQKEYYCLPQLIRLERNLVGLHLLEKGDYHNLLKEDLLNQTPFHLFQLESKGECNFEEQSKITPNLKTKIEDSAKILSRIKKK